MKDRIRQFADAFRQLREVDDRAVPAIAAAVLLGLLVGAGLGALITVWVAPILALVFGWIGAMTMFNRRLQKAQYRAIEGQAGAAAAVLQAMRGQWFVSPGVAVNAKQDMVHRALGRCGVVLVGEGSSQRVRGLLAKERKRLSRVVGDVPVTTVVVGDGEDDVSLNKLQMKLNKLPRKLKKTEVPRLERRLKPLDKAPPVPKGIDPFSAANRKRPKPR